MQCNVDLSGYISIHRKTITVLYLVTEAVICYISPNCGYSIYKNLYNYFWLQHTKTRRSKAAYQRILNVCPFDYTAVAGSGKLGP